MKFSSVACTAFLASMALAKTHFVTRMHYITVDAQGHIVGSSEFLEGDNATNDNAVVTLGSSAAATETNAATTPLTVTASYNSVSKVVAGTSQTTTPSTPTSTAKTATSSASSSSESGIYAQISSSGADASFAKSILDAHNKKRALHSASDLSWDTTCYKYAQNYAEKYTCGSSLVHSGGPYGENLAEGYSDGVAAFNAWYSEGNNYDYSTANVFDHFTQIIWKSTTKLGCAYKDCGSGWYVICSYDPAGNVVGYGPQNLSSS